MANAPRNCENLEVLPDLHDRLVKLADLVNRAKMVQPDNSESFKSLVSEASELGPIKSPPGLFFVARCGLRSRVSKVESKGQNATWIQVLTQRGLILANRIKFMDSPVVDSNNQSLHWEFCTAALRVVRLSANPLHYTEPTPFRLHLGPLALKNIFIVQTSLLKKVWPLHSCSGPYKTTS